MSPRKPKERPTKAEHNTKKLNRFKLHRPNNEKFSVAQLYATAQKVPYPEELATLSNGQLAQEFGVEAKYVSVIRAALEDISSSKANGQRDIWTEWQAGNGGGE